MRNAIVRSAVVLAAWMAMGPAATAAEPGPGTEKLEQAIAELRKDYLSKLDSGDEDHELRNLVRDLNAARSKGDWNRVAALLATRGIDFGALGGASDGAASGGDAADELWPVRTGSGGAGSSPEGKPVSEKVKYETVNGLTIRAIV
ncbi:MAG: hypothetical protein ACYS9X_15020, partial [Planctomycetota bacterium]